MTKWNNDWTFVEPASCVVDYIDGDVTILDNVRNLTHIYPLKPMTNLLVMCTSGKTILNVNGQESQIVIGELLVCPPNVEIDDCTPSKDFECKIICLSDHIIQTLLCDRISVWNHAIYQNQTNITPFSQFRREEFGYYYELLRSKISRSEKKSSRIIVQTIIRAMLLELCDVLEDKEGSGEEPRILQSRQLFNRFLNLLSNSEVKRQPVAYYAGQLAVTPKYLNMLCQQYSKKTVTDWIVRYTLDDIRYYLADADYSIKEISIRLGFSDVSHFGAYVRRHLRMSPTEYRRKKFVKEQLPR